MTNPTELKALSEENWRNVLLWLDGVRASVAAHGEFKTLEGYGRTASDAVAKAMRVIDAFADGHLLPSDRVRELEEENARLREALKPFAKAGSLFSPLPHRSYNETIYAPSAGPDYYILGDDLRLAYRTLGIEHGPYTSQSAALSQGEG